MVIKNKVSDLCHAEGAKKNKNNFLVINKIR